MTNAEAIRILLNEWKCIDRNDGINCNRKCESCDLVMDSEVLKNAYNLAIKALEAQEWIPVKKRLPEEDNWLGGSGKQFSDNVLISITNREDEDAWSDISQTIDGEWGLELPRYCKITAWKPLPEPYQEERRTDAVN